MSRRAAGERLPDDSVTAMHSELMPELGEELALLAMMERARRAAESPSSAREGLAGREVSLTDAARRGARWDAAFTPGESGLPEPAIPDASNIAALLEFRGYAITREIHRGGQGVVYEALQKSTSRAVAVKVLHESQAPQARDLARFEREILILGLLKHPNLVSVHDSGSVAGRHFLVMDLIDGQPLHLFDAVRMAGRPTVAGAPAAAARDVRAAVARFVKICDAVNAAHLRGIIHRDLKPGNILVDDAGEPHVLDFGLAKILAAGELTQLTMTAEGQFVGSLPWASPEQAGGAAELLDVRSDVYSLGVILFQVLTGRFPYPVDGNWRVVADHIARTEPARPRNIRSELDADLENIVLKCLAKDAVRRYQSAGELRDDLRRWLAGEPVAARGDSAWYVVRKVVRRHRLATAAALSFVTLVTGAAIVASALYQRERAALKLAETARADALAESAKLKAVNRFLNGMLASASPEKKGKDVKVVDLLENAEASIEEQLGEQPLVEASVRSTIGETYMGLGMLNEAEAQFGAARELRLVQLGENADETVSSTFSLAIVSWMRGELERAQTLLTGAIAAKGLNIADAPLTEDSVELFRLYNAILNARGRFDKTVENAQRILEYNRSTHGPTHHHTISSMNSLAFALDCNQREAEAEPIFREALALSRQHLSADHPLTQSIMVSYANMLRAVDRPDEALPILLEVLESRRRTLPEGHPGIGDCLMELAAINAGRGEMDECLANIDEAVRIHRAALGDESWRTAGTRAYAASYYMKLSRHEEAEEHAIAAFEILEKTWGEHRQVENGISGIILALYDQWQKPDQVAEWRERIDRANGKLAAP